MDIYSAESHVKKLLKYVQELDISKPRMYDKSKDRLRDLALTCNQVVKVISSILQDETLIRDEEEFGTISDIHISKVLTSMQSELSQLQKFVKYGAYEDSVETVIPVSTNKTTISSSMRKQALSQYGSILHKLAGSFIEYSAVSDCAKLLWNWFDTRFFRCNNKKFRYNIRRIPNWIRDIVIVYSNALYIGQSAGFIQQFNTWCESLLYSDAGDKFAVPYEVYQFDKNPDQVTLTAVVIWDLLLDNGLRKLCTSNPSDLYLREDCVYNLCGKLNPDYLDNYTDYKNDMNLLNSCKILNTFGGEIQ